MNNNLSIGTNLSGAIKNFNLCNNEFIMSDNKGARNAILSYAFGNKKNNFHKNEGVIKKDEKEIAQQFSELKQMNQIDNKKLIKKLNIEDQIKSKTFENVYFMNKLNNLPETKLFKEDLEKVKKKITFATVALTFYTVYALMEFYDSKSKIYDNVKDLMNDRRSKVNLFNYKRNMMIGLPLLLFLYLQYSNYRKIEIAYKDLIREKYYDEENALENFKMVADVKY